jgi:LacI family transcriptional regulator
MRTVSQTRAGLPAPHEMATSGRTGRRMTTIQDVAGDLGLSAMTVSRALNGHPDVKEQTRQRVIDRAAELNYRPNRWARSLVTQRSHVIGAVIPAVSHAFFSLVIGEAAAAFEEKGYTMILCQSSGDPDRERRAVDMLVGSRADGLVVASVCHHDDPSLYQGLQAEGVPVVLLDRMFSDFDAPSISADDFEVGRIAAQHLISLGHRKIAHIKGDPLSTGVLRRKGFLAGAQEAGVDVPDEYVVEGGFDVEGGMRGMNRLLQLDQRPTGVFGPSDPAAMGAVRACREADLIVPADISIIGVGAVEQDYLPDPFMTTMDWDRRTMGRAAADMLLQLIEGKTPPERSIVRKPRLLVHRSTAML